MRPLARAMGESARPPRSVRVLPDQPVQQRKPDPRSATHRLDDLFFPDGNNIEVMNYNR
jgi:hypothetical protein